MVTGGEGDRATRTSGAGGRRGLDAAGLMPS